MSITHQLLKLFQVDKQLRGLRSRLDGAERFLEQQRGFLKDIEEKTSAITSQVKHLRAAIANDEGEAARIEAKIAAIREQINGLKTAKEYNAGLTELNTFKEAKTKHEDAAVEAMGRLESLESQAADLKKLKEERAKIVAGAESDRQTKEIEIKDRLQELKSQRDALAAEIPKESLSSLESLIKLRGDDAMAPVEVLDRRNLEYSCTACMMTLPVETVSAMLSGRLTKCVSCHCIIYTEDEILPSKPAPKSPKGAKSPKAPKAPKQVA